MTAPAPERERRGLYPPIEPHRTGHLPVGDGHSLYWEESGNPDGKPVVFLHGGPGGGSEPRHRRFFDPAAYRIVVYDQRGCGRSTPHVAEGPAGLAHNTTWDLVADLERLREHLSGLDRGARPIARWQVFGGSWGSTLALAYAQTHPERVSELVLRGIFLVRKWEIDWFYQGGCSHLFPDAWEDFVRPIPPEERGDFVAAYHRRLTSPERAVRVEAARAWSVWEGRTSYLLANADAVAHHDEDDFAAAFAGIECHYFVNRCWLDGPRALLENVDRIRHLPATLVQGRYDVVCPMESAWALHRAWPEAALVVVPDAGHSAFEPGNVAALVEATDRYR